MELAQSECSQIVFEHSCLTETPVPFRRDESEQIELHCCTRHWTRRLGLDANLEHWRRHKHILEASERRLSKDDWALKLGALTDKRQLIEDFMFLKAAHALFLPPGRWHLVPGRFDRIIAAINMAYLTASAFAQLDRLLPVLRTQGRSVITVVVRDDVPIPDDRSLRLWCGWAERLAPKGVELRLFAQNVAPLAAGVAAAQPIGIYERNALSWFLGSARGAQARSAAQRTTLLLCCCLGTGLRPQRRAAVATLVRNGFACNASDLGEEPPAQPGRPEPLRNYSGSIWRYYASLAAARFVAAPRGHGRDTYRVWEALACGAFPILHRDEWPAPDAAKLEGLPVLWADSWHEVTRPFLHRQWRLLSDRQFDARRLHAPFWLGTMTAATSRAHANATAACSRLRATPNRSVVEPRTWLATAARGHCGFTVDDGSRQCDSGESGALGLTGAERASWDAAAAACLAKCRGCARCHYISVSPRFGDCSWYARCDRSSSHGDALALSEFRWGVATV